MVVDIWVLSYTFNRGEREKKKGKEFCCQTEIPRWNQGVAWLLYLQR
jgi:hypothetical protein